MAAIVAAEGNGTGKGDDGQYWAKNLTMQSIVSMAIKAFVELGIPDILFNAKEPLTAEQIVSGFATKSKGASPYNLKRLLRPLVREGVVGQSLNEENIPVYSSTNISRWFTTGDEYNVVPLVGLFFTKEVTSAWPHLKESVLDDATVPFEVENGVSLYEHLEKDEELRTTWQKGMLGTNPKAEVRELVVRLQQTGALDGVKTFMDLGGGYLGFISGLVVAQNPHIHGINFDLPPVVATAPPIKGVEHVGGDYFKSLPSADAIFMKFILHNHGDEESIHILKNVYKALPSKGKVIVAEYVFSDSKDDNLVGRFTEYMDLIMMALNRTGNERTIEEYEQLLKAAGFSHVSLLLNPEGMDFVIAVKE